MQAGQVIKNIPLAIVWPSAVLADFAIRPLTAIATHARGAHALNLSPGNLSLSPNCSARFHVFFAESVQFGAAQGRRIVQVTHPHHAPYC